MRIPEINKLHDVDLPEGYFKLTSVQRESLCIWISDNIFPRNTPNLNYNSYSLKHMFEHDKGGFYITNGQFKGAMIDCGFFPINEEEKNWRFCISQKSPVFKKNLSNF